MSVDAGAKCPHNCQFQRRDYEITERNGYVARMYTQDYGSTHYYRDGAFVVGMASTNGHTQVCCPCCGRCVEEQHTRGDYPCEYVRTEPLATVSDVADIDFRAVLEVCGHPNHTRAQVDLAYTNTEVVFYRFDTEDVDPPPEAFITTKAFGDRQVVLACETEWGGYLLNPRFAYYVLVCPHDKDTVGVVFVSWDGHMFPENVRRYRIPAAQITQLPTFSVRKQN